ncbi:MAG TPA: hypothetical protein VHR66_24650 [Gemmataceae bacterium]|jgi:hypothetical protein|nr:hypothetical protein [Gemmataceae bacterium]
MALRSCDPFDIPVPGDLPAVLARVQTAIVAEGGRFAGDATAGHFAGVSPVGTIEGRYAASGSVVRITITNKPMLAPCGMIEAKIRQYFA